MNNVLDQLASFLGNICNKLFFILGCTLGVAFTTWWQLDNMDAGSFITTIAVWMAIIPVFTFGYFSYFMMELKELPTLIKELSIDATELAKDNFEKVSFRYMYTVFRFAMNHADLLDKHMNISKMALFFPVMSTIALPISVLLSVLVFIANLVLLLTMVI